MNEKHIRLAKLAHLSRITVPKEQEQTMIDRLQFMIDWVNKLNELDLNDVEPLRVMTFENQVTRNDDPKNTMTIENAIKVAPKTEDNHFIVPKVIK